MIFKTVSVYSVKTQGNELAVIVVNDELWAVLQSISLEGGNSHTSTACLRARQCKREKKEEEEGEDIQDDKDSVIAKDKIGLS